MGSAERRERERAEMRERILSAATRLFVEESFEETTMRRIAEAIEYTPGALYGYFKDKDAILYAIHLRGFDELLERMNAALAGRTDPVERLRALGLAYIRFALDNPAQYQLMFVAQHKQIREDHDWTPGLRAYDLTRAVIREVVAQQGGAGDPEVLAFACWSMVHGMVSLVLGDRCVMFPEGTFPALLETTLDHVLARLTGGGA